MQTCEHPIVAACRLLGGRRALAERLAVTQSAIGNWKARGVPIMIAAAIESATAGAVTRRDLRPDDWHLIWPELAVVEPNPAESPAHSSQDAINTVAIGEVANA